MPIENYDQNVFPFCEMGNCSEENILSMSRMCRERLFCDKHLLKIYFAIPFTFIYFAHTSIWKYISFH